MTGTMHDLGDVAPAFRDMAHRIVWCVAATTDRDGRPTTRVLHPLWEWDGSALTGWVATSPASPKAAHLAGVPEMSLTYWDPSQDTATADCAVEWETGAEQRRAAWDRFATTPPPVGYDPAIIPGWDSSDSPGFGVIRLLPRHLRVMPGTLLLSGQGELLRWRAG